MMPEAGATGGVQSEKEDKVSMELTEEILKSMEVGMAFRDYVTASDDDSIRLYDVANAMCLKTINSKKYGVELVCFASNATTVLYSSKNGWDESLRLLNLNDNKYLRYFKGHHDRVVSLNFCSWKELFISGSLDRTVILWDQRAEKCQVKTLTLYLSTDNPFTRARKACIVFSIALGGYIRMFDAHMHDKGPFDIFSVGGDVSDANVVKFSHDGTHMLLATTGGHIHVLDSFRGTLLSTYNVKPVSSRCSYPRTMSSQFQAIPL